MRLLCLNSESEANPVGLLRAYSRQAIPRSVKCSACGQDEALRENRGKPLSQTCSQRRLLEEVRVQLKT